jgi:hypothetical protein
MTELRKARKRRNRQPSIISSETDRRFSPSHDTESSDSPGDLPSDSSDSPASPPPLPAPQKRRRATAKCVVDAPAPQDNPNPSIMLDYIVAIFPPAELKKAITKRVSKNMSLRLSTDEPWDTVKAQILVKIDTALNPQTINFENYSIAYTIPRIVTKPGYPLSNANDYALLVDRARKPKLVHLHVTPVVNLDNKENEPANDAEKTKKKRSRINPEDLPSYVAKIAGIQALQVHWKCLKQTTKCFGVYCFVDKEGVHLPLSHEMIDCWAMCIVRVPSSRIHTG